ncbi:MAG: hypothetical protein ACOYND_02125 [Bacteroidota bacterium]|jgi:hypothetical protein
MKKALTVSYTGMWAFIESALGNILHAAKIPFRGMFMTAFSCFCIEHIAKNNKGFSHNIHSLGSVLLIKAIASPHSPIGAYIAVSFQGIVGLWIYNSTFSPFRLYLFNCIAQVETALQRIIGIAFTFGFIPYVVLQTHQKNELISWFQSYNVAHYTYILSLLYIALHLCAGIVFPFMISTYGALSPEQMQPFIESYTEISEQNNTNSKKKSLQVLLIRGCILSVIYISTYTLLSENIPSFLYSLIISIVSIAFLLLVIYPMFAIIIDRYIRKNIHKEYKIIDIMDEVQGLKQLFIVYTKNNRSQNFIIKSIHFIRMLISLK